MSEYKSSCGCAIHVAQWTAKRKVVTQKSCPLHKNAPELLSALKALLVWAATHSDADFEGKGESSKMNADWRNARDLIARIESEEPRTP